MWTILAIAVMIFPISILAYHVQDLLQGRDQIKGLPQPPMQNKLLGHLYIAAECMKVFPQGVHTQAWADYIRTKWSLPEVFYLDWRPIGPLWLFIADPEILHEHVLTKQCLPKAGPMVRYVEMFLGKNNMVAIEGHRWKGLRTAFNPGFSSASILAYTDSIVESSIRFLAILKEKAKTNEIVEFEALSTRLTVDIIGNAIFNVDMQAQTVEHPIARCFRQRVKLMPRDDAVFPWQDFSITRPLRLWWNSRKLDEAIEVELEDCILRRAAEMQEEKQDSRKSAKRVSIVDLALSTYEKGTSKSQSGETCLTSTLKDIPPQIKEDIKQGIKTFFFAGHDTTSSTLCWCFYLLHRNPEVHTKLVAELDHFLPRQESVADAIRQDPRLVNKLEYTTAVIKETLRLFPPASSIREIDDSKSSAHHDTLEVPGADRDYPMRGAAIWAIPHLVGRNKRFFPQPTSFIPERFIQSQTPFPDAELFHPAGRYAFQAFSIGPRNCIGQELAMNEARIILALTTREVDFVLEYPGEEADLQPPIPESTATEFAEDTVYGDGIRTGAIKPNVVEGHRLWPTLSGAAKPNGRCPGRIKLR